MSPGDSIAFTVGQGGVGEVAGGDTTDGGDSSLTIAGVTITGGGGQRAGSNAAGGVGSTNTPAGTLLANGGAGWANRYGEDGQHNDGVCGAGGGAGGALGLDNHFQGGWGGCYPAGEGGHGPSQWGFVVPNPAEPDEGRWTLTQLRNDGYTGPDIDFAYVQQPGGHGLGYGGGGGAGGNYWGIGGNGAGGYVLFSWTSDAPLYSTDVIGVAVTSGAQTDTTGWTDISSVTTSAVTTDGAVFYAVSTDDRGSFAIHGSDGWHTIVTSLITNPTEDPGPPLWQYNSSATFGLDTWTDCASNTLMGCLQDAFALSINQMTSTQLANISSAEWTDSGAPASGTLDFAIGMRTTNASSSPSVSTITVSQ